MAKGEKAAEPVGASELSGEGKPGLLLEDAFLNAAFRLAPLGMAILSPQGTFQRVNDSFCEFLGYSREELQGRSFVSLTHPEDQERSAERFERLLNNNHPVRLEKRYTRKDGSIVDVLLHSSPVCDQHGSILGLVSIFEDISARKEAESKLLLAEQARKHEEERYQALAEFSPVGIWQINPEGYTRYVNSRMLQMLDLPSAGELEGITFHEFIAPEDLESLESNHSLRPDGVASTYQVTLVSRGGVRRPVLIVGSPLVNADGQLEGLMGSFVDLTERRALEADLRHLQKLDSVGRVAAGIAHDFNNLLMIIHAHFAMPHDEEAAQAKESLQAARQAARRAVNLTRQLLVFSRKQPMKQRRVDWNDATQSNVGMLRRILGEQIRLRIDLSGEPAFVFADPAMLDHVLINLAVNARDAMERKGSVTLSTDRLKIESWGFDGAPDAAPGSYWRLSFSDDGPGILSELQTEICKPFFTTKDPERGTGLGLSTAAEILRQHGGWLTLESQPGQGATFHLILPESLAEAQPSLMERPRVCEVARKAAVLVVEAQTVVARFLSHSLGRAGHTSEQVEDVGEAFLLAAEKHFDLLILDLDLIPPTERQSLFLRFSQQNPGIKLLLMTGSHEISPERSAQRCVLAKPFSSETLLAEVEALLSISDD